MNTSEIMREAELDYMSEILTAGILKDKLNDLGEQDLRALFPIYHNEALQNKLHLPSVAEDKRGLNGLSGFSLSKAHSWVKKTLKNPSRSILDPLKHTVKPFSKSAADKIEHFATNSKIVKAHDYVNQYFYKNPGVALAIAAVVPGLNIVAIAVAAGLAIAAQQLSARQQKVLQKEQEKYQRNAAIASEAGMQIEPPPIYWDGTVDEFLALIKTEKFKAALRENIKKNIIENMGYPDNKATNVMVDKATAASLLDMETRAKNGELKPVPKDDGGIAKIAVPVAVAAASYFLS